MLEMNCYKMFRIAKMFSESEIACQLEGGIVAKPITLLQVRAIQITRDIQRGWGLSKCHMFIFHLASLNIYNALKSKI